MTNPVIIAVCCTKGGVGKTTICCGIASALEAMGKAVLVVDLDPNADTSTALGINPMDETVIPGAFELMCNRKPTPILFERHSGIDGEISSPTGIYLLPGDERLVSNDVATLFQETLKLTLAHVRHPLTGKPFDAIVLDLPTAPRQLIHQGLRAATAVVHVVDAHMFAVKKVEALRRQCAEWSACGIDITPRHSIVASKINMSRRRDKDLLSLLPERFKGDPQFTIKQDEALANATADAVPIFDRVRGKENGDALTSIAQWAIGSSAKEHK